MVVIVYFSMKENIKKISNIPSSTITQYYEPIYDNEDAHKLKKKSKTHTNNLKVNDTQVSPSPN